MEYVDFNDEKIPIGKRKQAYVKWAMSKGTSKIAAKTQANKKFGFEPKKHLVIIVVDYGRINQRSFGGEREVLDICGIDRRKYKSVEFVWPSSDDCCYIDKPEEYAKVHTVGDIEYKVVYLCA